MSYEVVHTSVVRGLRGESGFATAIATRGLPPGLDAGLEEVSGYHHDASRAIGVDEVEWAHRMVTIRGRKYTVLSRIAPNGLDGSLRPNRIAHHLVVQPADRAVGGPAWLLGQYAAFETGTPEVAERASPPTIPRGDLPPRPAHSWESAGFDPGWAGRVAETILGFPRAVVYVVLPEAMSALPMVIDVLALIPSDLRWHATFSTRPLECPPHATCQLRFVRKEAPGLDRLLAEPGVRVIRVERGSDAGHGAAAQAAREGMLVETPFQTARSTPGWDGESTSVAVRPDFIGRGSRVPYRLSDQRSDDLIESESPYLEPRHAAERKDVFERTPQGRVDDRSRSRLRLPISLPTILFIYAACASAGGLILFAFVALRV
jgi:hypothetical protein